MFENMIRQHRRNRERVQEADMIWCEEKRRLLREMRESLHLNVVGPSHQQPNKIEECRTEASNNRSGRLQPPALLVIQEVFWVLELPEGILTVRGLLSHLAGFSQEVT